MNTVQVFEHPELGKIRVVDNNNTPWFVGKDIAAALGYSDTFGALKKHVDDEDKQNFQHNSFETPRGMTVINENGFYSLAFSSKLPNAKQVKNWIARDVLPVLREHNNPIKNDDNMSEPCISASNMDKKYAVQIFENPEFGEIRIMKINGEPWFVGKDIANVLQYENPTKAIRDHVLESDKIMGVQNVSPFIKDSLGRIQYPTWINESGLYSLIFTSKLPAAQKFQHWVTSEVLPSIRKTGMYIPNPATSRYDISELSPSLQMANALSKTLNTLLGNIDALFDSMAQAEMEQKRQAEEQARQAEEQERIVQEQTRQAAEQKRQAQEQEQHTEALKTVDRKLEDIRDVVVTRPETWRKDCLHLVSAIAQKRGGDSKAYQDTNVEIFNLVDQRAHVSLQTRLTNRLNRMKAEGVGKSKQKKLNKIDIIAEDNKLIEIYIAIIKEMCVQYEVSPSVLDEAQGA